MRVAVEVWWSSLVAAHPDLLDVLDPVERARLEGVQREADRGRSLVGFALLRSAVGEHLGVAPGDVVVDRTCEDCGGPHGRPRMTGPLGPLHVAPSVSVSHSGLLVVVALSVDAVVGVDVQRVADLAPGADPVPAAEAWVRREAVRKLGADGRPSLVPLAPPLDGYAAALAALAPGAALGAHVDVVQRRWGPRPGGPGPLA